MCAKTKLCVHHPHRVIYRSSKRISMLSFVNIIIARHCQLVSRYLFSNFSCYVLFFPDIIRMCMCVCYFLSFSLSLAFHSFRFCLKTFSYFHFMFWHFRKKNFLRYYYMNISYDYTMDVIFKSNGKWQSKRYTLLTAADKILWWIKIPYVILANKRQTMSCAHHTSVREG